jgi:hypothetical protein
LYSTLPSSTSWEKEGTAVMLSRSFFLPICLVFKAVLPSSPRVHSSSSCPFPVNYSSCDLLLRHYLRLATTSTGGSYDSIAQLTCLPDGCQRTDICRLAGRAVVRISDKGVKGCIRRYSGGTRSRERSRSPLSWSCLHLGRPWHLV